MMLSTVSTCPGRLPAKDRLHRSHRAAQPSRTDRAPPTLVWLHPEPVDDEGDVDHASVRVTPDLSPQPECEHPGARCLRLLFTDPGHPTVPAVAEVLRRACRRAHLAGGFTQHPQPPPPPGISRIVDGRSGWEGAIDAALSPAAEGGCDTILPLTAADVRILTSAEMRKEIEYDNDVQLVCPPDPMISLTRSRWQLMQHVRDLDLPVLPAVRVSRGGDLATAAAELGYPDTDLTVVPDDVLDDTGAWTVSAHTGLTSPGRRLPLAALSALLDHDPQQAQRTVAVVRPAPGAHRDDPHPGQCTVDLVADNGGVLAVLARRPGTPPIGSTGGIAVTETVVALPAPARELVIAVARGLRWTGPATIRLAGIDGTPVITDVLPWLDPGAYLGAYTGADIVTAAVRHARSEPIASPGPVWEPTPTTARRYDLLQRWAHL